MTFIIISCVTFTKILTKTVGGLQSYFVSDVRVHDIFLIFLAMLTGHSLELFLVNHYNPRL